MIRFALLISTALWGAPALSEELIFGFGYADFGDTDAMNTPILTAEYHHTTFHEIAGWDVSLGAVVSIDGEHDVYFGAGLVNKRRLGGPWFAEFSSMVGLYYLGTPHNDLGSKLEFRHLLALGRDIGKDNAISLALTHTSNGSTGRINPGMNTLALRWHTKF